MNVRFSKSHTYRREGCVATCSKCEFTCSLSDAIWLVAIVRETLIDLKVS